MSKWYRLVGGPLDGEQVRGPDTNAPNTYLHEYPDGAQIHYILVEMHYPDGRQEPCYYYGEAP